jgi:signal transduction histidine kinase
MESLGLGKIVLFYIRERLVSLLVLLLAGLIFGTVFFAYSLPLEPVLYALALTLLMLIIVFVLDFRRYLKRHREISAMAGRISLGLESLPEYPSLSDRDYRALLKELQEENARLVSEADSEKSQMSEYYTLWAHQIKTPIAAMRLLIRSEPSESVNELSLELFKIEQYVEALLQYLRLETMSSDLLLAEYAVGAIVKQAVRKYAKMFISRGISLRLSETELRAVTDEKWLCFVIEQLLSNALKYTLRGEISIYTQEKSLIIEDSGVGIAPEDLPRIFERGFTGYNGRMDKKSTGIGLYLTVKILKRLGHSIEAESELGKGTRIRIIFD